jgi:hypothetical protein
MHVCVCMCVCLCMCSRKSACKKPQASPQFSPSLSGNGLPFALSEDLSELYVRGEGPIGHRDVYAIKISDGSRRPVLQFSKLPGWSKANAIAVAYGVVLAAVSDSQSIIAFAETSGAVLSTHPVQMIKYQKTEGACT